MRPRSCLLLLLIVPALANGGQEEIAWRDGPDKPVYVVTENHYAEGFGPSGETAKFRDLLAIEIYSQELRAEGQGAAYNVGERLALFVGGERRGAVQIKKVVGLQCDSSAALVTAGPAVHLAKGTMALATNAGKVRAHKSDRRLADVAEQNVARRLALDAFVKHGLALKTTTGIKVDRLAVTRIDESAIRFLIGSLSIKTKDAKHRVFLIGRLDNSGPATTELERYHATTDLVEGTDGENVRFVDQLDMDGDGSDEIVIEVTGYESEGFEIYRRSHDTWSKVGEGGQGGC
jgi:hypothetical protein